MDDESIPVWLADLPFPAALVTPAGLQTANAAWRRLQDERGPVAVPADGVPCLLPAPGAPPAHLVPLDGGRWLALVGTCPEDRTAELARLDQVVEQTADGVMITDREGVILYVNRAFETMTGYRREECLGNKPRLVRSGFHDAAFYQRLWDTILAGKPFRDVFVNRRKDGSLYYEDKTISPMMDARGRITHFVSTGRDITERIQVQERLHRLAYHDPLTGLPNRALFRERLEHALALARRRGNGLAVLFLDLDRFKNVNDTLGHACGDRVLTLVAERLRGALRGGDTLARLGGDEFAVLIEGDTSREALSRIGRKLQALFEPPFFACGHEFHLGLSLGVARYPEDGDDVEGLLKYADMAMYHAKQRGGGVRFYHHRLGGRIRRRMSLELRLRRAVQREELDLVYQPRVDLEHLRLRGAEALLRWPAGRVGPERFVPVLEEMGLIDEVGRWVRYRALEQLRRWRERYGVALCLSLNVAAPELSRPSVAREFRGVLESVGLADGRGVELELTERVLFQDDARTQRRLNALRELGLRIALDDFGTGYSSLSYLKRMPIDVIKLDRSFVADLPGERGSLAIVRAVLALSEALDMTVVAEGVESDRQLDFLRRQRCDEAQGYYVSPPVSAGEFEGLLAAGA